MKEAVTQVGRAITASALTVAAGLGALAFSSFPALPDLGVVIVVEVVFASNPSGDPGDELKPAAPIARFCSGRSRVYSSA